MNMLESQIFYGLLRILESVVLRQLSLISHGLLTSHVWVIKPMCFTWFFTESNPA
jgi:hypothetical protein